MDTIRIALVASLALSGPALAAGDAGGAASAQEREQVRAQVHRQLTAEGEVSERDASEVDAEVGAHAGATGYGPAMKQAIHDAHAAGCTGQCLVEVVHGINGAMDRGATADAAARQATSGLARGAGRPSDPQARAADRRRDAMHGDAAADRAHDREMDHGGQGQAGTHGMGSGHH